MNEQEPVAEEKCRDIKRGYVDLHCTLPKDHPEWHHATFTDHREVTYDGGHHVIHTVESVTWEPADHIREAVNHLMAGRKNP